MIVKNDLRQFLLELETHGEMMIGLIEYFTTNFNDEGEIDTEIILQSFRILWESYNNTINNFTFILLEVIESRDK